MAEGKWRELPPVEQSVSIEPEPESGEMRISQTLLRAHDRCDRAAYLYLKHEGGAGSAELNRGSVFHRFAAKATNLLIEEDEQKLAPEVGKEILREVYTESPELTVPHAERDSLRAMVYNFCVGTYFTPANIIGVEQSFRLEIGGWVLRCKLDLAERIDYGQIDVTDYKTSFAIPDQASFEGDYQGVLYLLAVAFGETDAGLKVSDGVEEFRYRQRFPRYLRGDEEGLADTEPLIFARADLHERRVDLEDQLRRLEASFESNLYPATPGSHCAECPAPQECPLPRHLRPDSQMALGTYEEALALAAWWYVTGERVKRAKRRLKGWSDHHGRNAIPVGKGLELVFVEREEYAALDRETLLLEAEGAAQYGHDFDAEKYLKKRPSVRFELRKTFPKEDQQEGAE